MTKSHLCRIAKGFCKVRRIRIKILAIPQNLAKIDLFFWIATAFFKTFRNDGNVFYIYIDSCEFNKLNSRNNSFTVFTSERNERSKLQIINIYKNVNTTKRFYFLYFGFATHTTHKSKSAITKIV